MSNDRLIEIDAGVAGGHVGPVIAVSELPRARRFYEGQLGLSGEAVPGSWMLRTQSGTVCYLLAEIPDAGSASWPVASFSVQDLRATVRQLRERDVPFLEASDLPLELDEDGISAAAPGCWRPGCVTPTARS